MTSYSVPGNRYDRVLYRVKVNLFGSMVTVHDETGSVLFNVPVKDKGTDSEIAMSLGKKGGTALMAIRPVYEKPKGFIGKFLGLIMSPSHFEVIDLKANVKVGALKRESTGSDPKDHAWLLLDASDTEIGIVKPVSSGFLGASFQHRGQVGSHHVCDFTAANSIAGRYVDADFTVDEDEDLDVRLGLAVAIKLVVAMKEMHSGGE